MSVVSLSLCDGTDPKHLGSSKAVRVESEEGEETFVLIQDFSTLSILLSLRLLPTVSVWTLMSDRTKDFSKSARLRMGFS